MVILSGSTYGYSRDWDTTENLYIEGDNLDVLKILQESYLGKVKMIYIEIIMQTMIQGIGKIKKCAFAV